MAGNKAPINPNGGKGSYAQGIYQIKNTEKYISPHDAVWRSSWEYDFCCVCDENPAIIQWGVEPFYIPYLNPITNTVKQYYPDFIIVYIDKSGKQIIDLIEIKPFNESIMEAAKTKKNKAAVVINHAKWEAAYEFAKNNGMNFRILTERELYANKRR